MVGRHARQRQRRGGDAAVLTHLQHQLPSGREYQHPRARRIRSALPFAMVSMRGVGLHPTHRLVESVKSVTSVHPAQLHIQNNECRPFGDG
jgi:hypothetical protein